MAVAAMLCACGGREQPASPAAPTPIYTAQFPPVLVEEGGISLTSACVPARALPDAAGPDCIVARALVPDAGTAGDDACRACNEPGLAPLPASFPPSSISPDLSGYGCVCLVKSSGSCGPSIALPASPFAWCSADGTDGLKLGCPSGYAIILAESVAEDADVVVACYAPGTLLP
jgi:hypothetical protein